MAPGSSGPGGRRSAEHGTCLGGQCVGASCFLYCAVASRPACRTIGSETARQARTERCTQQRNRARGATMTKRRAAMPGSKEHERGVYGTKQNKTKQKAREREIERERQREKKATKPSCTVPVACVVRRGRDRLDMRSLNFVAFETFSQKKPLFWGKGGAAVAKRSEGRGQKEDGRRYRPGVGRGGEGRGGGRKGPSQKKTPPQAPTHAPVTWFLHGSSAGPVRSSRALARPALGQQEHAGMGGDTADLPMHACIYTPWAPLPGSR